VNVASKNWVTDQYDSMVGTVNMSTNNPSDAGIVNLKGLNKAIAVTVDCNARYVYANPEEGCAIAVAEAARNIVCSGGEPAAVTNCLNFGNPYSPEAYWQFVGSIKGMSKACEKFETPVTGGNVSFYNQSTIDGKTVPVLPTPTIGMIGIVNDKSKITPLGFTDEGLNLFLVGDHCDDFCSSQYLIHWHKQEYSPSPRFDLQEEYSMQKNLKTFIESGLINCAHDISDGGLFVCLAEMAFPKNLGFEVKIDSSGRLDGLLFGEGQSRVVVGIETKNRGFFLAQANELGQRVHEIGKVSGTIASVNKASFGSIDSLKSIHSNALRNLMQN
jgi:phosphoribosylformylglycinamidine synthase subunit PurL